MKDRIKRIRAESNFDFCPILFDPAFHPRHPRTIASASVGGSERRLLGGLGVVPEVLDVAEAGGVHG